MRAKIILVAAAVALAALAAWLYYDRSAEAPAPEPVAAPAPPVESPPEIRYPVPEPVATEEPGPPPLDDSDEAMLESLVGLVGEPLREMLIPDILVRRIVATVDGLARPKLAVRVRPTRPAAGAFVTAEAEGGRVISEENYARYAPYVQLLSGLEAAQLADLYFLFYPRFQQAYQELGYPRGYFNDRLVAVIDDLLETPDVEGPIAVVRPKVMYEFADPDLEARSVGQKLLLRMGPENATIVKSKLRQLRIELTSRTPPPRTEEAPAD